MFELRTLGALDMRAAEGGVVESVLAQPKRIALLVYLAVAVPGGLHRRDPLLALFWPEADEARARNSLSQALHFLRRSLGEGVLVSRGEEIGLDTARLWCDVVAFEQVLDAGQLAEALRLYRGEFLPGFLIANAPEFERWVERERTRLRGRATRAMHSLAEEREAAGDLAGAAEWWRRLAAEEPLDSRISLRLMQALAATGDRTGALQHARIHAALLREELDLEPDPEVIALAERLRSEPAAAPVTPRVASSTISGNGSDAGAPAAIAGPLDAAPAPAAEPPSGASSPARGTDGTEAPPTSSGGRRRGRFFDRAPRRAIPFFLLLLVVLTIVAYALWERRSPDTAADMPTRVAVFPFAVRGSEEVAYLGEGMVTLLSTNLDGAGELYSVDPRALLGLLAREGGGPVDPLRGRALAGQLEADLYVLGDVVEGGEQLRINATLYERARTAAVAQAAIEGGAEEIFALVDRLTAQLLAGRITGPGAQLTRIAALTTSSLPALKAYLAGESHFHSRRYHQAVEAFQRAAAEDSTFALARYRLSIAADWAHEYELGGEAFEQAYRYRARLPEQERLLVEAMLGWHRVEPDESERLYRQVLANHPDNVEAWYRLGEVHFHLNPLRGRSYLESRDPFARVLDLDPDHTLALEHVALIAAREGEAAELDPVIERLLAHAPDDSLEWLSLRAFAVGDAREQEQVVARLRESGDDLLFTAAKDVAFYTLDFRGAQRLSRLLTEPTRNPELRAAGHLLLAYLELAHGRWRAAQEELRAVEALDPASALQYRALFTTLSFLPLPPGEVEAIRDALVRHEAPATPAPNPYLRVYTGMRPHMRLYLLGLLSARLRDVPAAQDYTVQLERMGETPEHRALNRMLASALRARIAAERGDAAEALATLESTRFESTEDLFLPPSGSHGHQRHLRPGLLRQLGREREALRWYGALPWYSALRENTLLDLVHLAPYHLGRAELYEHLGERENAAEHYDRFIELWQDADPELQPRVREAEQRLARLRPAGKPR